MSDDHDMHYTVDLELGNNQLFNSISRYLEGLVYSKVSDVSFVQIQNMPNAVGKTPYLGLEMIYNIIDSPKIYNGENQTDLEMEDDTFTQVNTLD